MWGKRSKDREGRPCLGWVLVVHVTVVEVFQRVG